MEQAYRVGKLSFLATAMLAAIGTRFGIAQTAIPAFPAAPVFLEPKPLVDGATVVALWPAGSPQLKALAGYDQPEKFQMSKTQPPIVQVVTNVHNPSIEVHLPPADKANGLAIIVSPGGGNTKLEMDTEGPVIAEWLNSLGIAAFVERYRLRPYGSGTDALMDTQQSIRMVRAHAKVWNVDPKRVGIMGFSAGGEQAARVALNYDAGKPDAADPVERESCRPDFAVLIYAGWAKPFDLSKVPKDAPPAFCTVAGVDDYFHSSETMDFVNAWLNAKIPVELHIYSHGGHGNGIKPRNGIPFGTWPARFVDWVNDAGLMKGSAAK